MKPTAQRAKWGEGVSPRKAFAARVEEQREQTQNRRLEAENARRRQLGMPEVKPEPQQEPQEVVFGNRIVVHGDFADTFRLNDEIVGRFQRAMEERFYRAVGLDPAVFGRRQTPEEMRRKEAERKAADERAKGLLREVGPEGQLLADGEAALIPSAHCSEITYGITPKEHGMVHVFHQRLGNLGKVCIQSQRPAPLADALFTRLMLCKHHEEELWRVGNFLAPEDMEYFLPKQIREWMGPRRQRNPYAQIFGAPPGVLGWPGY